MSIPASEAVAAVYTALEAAGGVSWPVYSGTVKADVRPPFIRIGEVQDVPRLTMGRRASEVVIPVHFFAADHSVVSMLAQVSAVVAALESDGAVTIAGRTVAAVTYEGSEDVGAELEGGRPVQHAIAIFRLWVV